MNNGGALILIIMKNKNSIFSTVVTFAVMMSIHTGCSRSKDLVLQEQIHINGAQKTVTVSLTNVSGKPVSFYSGLDRTSSTPMEIPPCVYIRAKDTMGMVMTGNDIIADGWYSPRLYSSQQKIDLSGAGLINLLPGEAYTRTYLISSFLWFPHRSIELREIDKVQFKIIPSPYLYSYSREVAEEIYVGDVIVTEWTSVRFD